MRHIVLALLFLIGFQFEALAQVPRAREKIPVVKKNKVADKSFVVGAEVRHYHYAEPGFVEHIGQMYGVWGEWYWMSPIGKGKFYGNLLFGKLTYKGALCNTSGTCTPYQGPTNDVIGKVATRFEYDLNRSFMLFGGIGYRYLYDLGEGAGFYRRVGQWFFVPVGAAVRMPGDASGSGAWQLEIEYDHIVMGQIKSDLSQARPNYDDLTLSQTGYGLAVKVGYQFTAEWSVEAIYERWDLQESESGTTNNETFREPKNHSDSYGLRIGYSF